MSVLKNKRTESKFEVFSNAYKLSVEMQKLLLRDMGVKDKTINLKYWNPYLNINEQDKTVLDNILEKYNLVDTLVGEYPLWIIDFYRSHIIKLSVEMMDNIRMANSIYVTNTLEYQERRMSQDKAIGNCEQLFDIIQIMLEVFNLDITKYQRYIDMINKEISLLKSWRKSDNSVLKKINK